MGLHYCSNYVMGLHYCSNMLGVTNFMGCIEKPNVNSHKSSVNECS